jgi:LysR family transcriptional regulator (chromosome initiation inhibitor)
MQHQWVSRAFGVREPRLRERHVPSSEAFVRAAAMGWGIGMAPLVQVRNLLASGALVALHPQLLSSVELYWHQWKLGPEGEVPSQRVALLDRVGAALESGARRALEAQVPSAPRVGAAGPG